MKRWILLAVLAVVAQAWSGCTRDSKEATPGKPGNPSQAGLPASGPEGTEAGYTLTKEKLDSYVQYQKALTTLYDGFLKDLEKLPTSLGHKREGLNNVAMRMLEGKARAEEKARAQVNLSERDVREIETMVMAVINRRSLARSFDPTTAIKQWESMRDSLPANQRADMDRSIGDLKQQQEAAVKLTDERKQFGDANIDLILSREDELTQAYNANVSRLTGQR